MPFFTSARRFSAIVCNLSYDTMTSSPTDDCTKLPATYISSLSNKTSSHISCNTSYHDHNILGVFVYRFEDCIEACTSFNHFQSSNTTCFGVTFDLRRPQQGGKGNCFLKDFRGTNATAMNGVSSVEMLEGGGLDLRRHEVHVLMLVQRVARL